MTLLKRIASRLIEWFFFMVGVIFLILFVIGFFFPGDDFDSF